MQKENFRILVVDDEQSFALLVMRILADEGYKVRSSSNPLEALGLIDSYQPDLVITDLKMPGMTGIEFMERAAEDCPGACFIMMTAFATIETAVAAMKLGAIDYITKPLRDPEELRQTVRKAFEKQDLLTQNMALREELGADMPPLPLIFGGMQETLAEVEAVAPMDTTVMLYGETGTGKSLIARAIHHMSRRKGPFITINCAAIPEGLLESELFGYEKGAFTGASGVKKGRFEMADEGTIFLDEIGEITPVLQGKLLRVLQEKRFERLGGLETFRTDARIVAATNRDLKQMVSEKQFREDLYYRLNVFPVHISPLRDRREILRELTEYLLRRLSARMGKKVTEIPAECIDRLNAYDWPGNIRELENVIEKAIILSRSGELSIPSLSDRQESDYSCNMKNIEKKTIEIALSRTDGNRKAAADMLGISLRALQYKIKYYEINL